MLASEFTELLLDQHANACVIFQPELFTPEDDGVPERTVRGGIWVSAVGELSDQRLADQVTEQALPAEVLEYHVGAPLPPPPVGGYPNQLPATSCGRPTGCDLWRAAATIGVRRETVWTCANR